MIGSGQQAVLHRSIESGASFAEQFAESTADSECIIVYLAPIQESQMKTERSQLSTSAQEPNVAFSGATGRRYQLTVAFIDLSGSTSLGRAMEPELYAELLAAIRHIWGQVVAHHGGSIVRTQGDGALVVFGFPSPHEDDGRRAVEAALDIQDQVEALRPSGLPVGFGSLQMHSGVHAGVLLLNDGDLERGRFDLVGDVANTAARLGQLARAGEILATLNALGPHANFFCSTDVTDRAMSEAATADTGTVRVVSVRGRNGTVRRFDSTLQRGLTPFVGRASTLQRLLDFVADLRQDAPSCLAIVGPAGIGKTRLLEELARSAEMGQLVILRGACESYLRAELLQPFMQIVRAHGQRCAALLPDLLVALRALCEGRQVVMLLDDWQWADDASRALLDTLIQPGPNRPRVVLTSRPQEDGQPRFAGVKHIVIAPFAQADTVQAVQTLLPQADPFLSAQIHDYAGGVPLFVEELCHCASADSLWRALQGRGPADTWLGALVASRLMRLPENLRELVRSAAVIGNVVPYQLLSKVATAVPNSESLNALAEADFLYVTNNSSELRFKHGITRDAVYASIGLKERMALHQRILEFSKADAGAVGADGQLERGYGGKSGDPYEALAYHSRGAGAWEEATVFSEWAGDKASVAFALDRARAHYLAAIEALERVPEIDRAGRLRWCSLAAKLGFTCIFDPLAIGDDLSLFERAVAVARESGDVGALAGALYWLGYMCYGSGRFKEGATHSRSALALAEAQGDVRLAAQVRAALGQTLAAACQYDEAVALIDQALTIKRLHGRSPSPITGRGLAVGSAYALACKGGVLADRGDFAAAHGCFGEAMTLLEGSLHPVANSVRNWIAIAHIWQGQWDEAARVATESVRIAESTGALLLLAVSRAVAGWAAWGARGDAVSLDLMRDAVRWMEHRQGRFYSSLQHGWLVEACFEQKKVAEARRHAARALWRTRSGELIGESTTCRALALAAAQAGDATSAARLMARSGRSASLRQSAREHALDGVVSSRIAALQGQQHESVLALARALEAFETLGMSWHHAKALQWGRSLTLLR